MYLILDDIVELENAQTIGKFRVVLNTLFGMVCVLVRNFDNVSNVFL